MKLMSSVFTISCRYISKNKLQCIAKMLHECVKTLKSQKNVTPYRVRIQKER